MVFDNKSTICNWSSHCITKRTEKSSINPNERNPAVCTYLEFRLSARARPDAQHKSKGSVRYKSLETHALIYSLLPGADQEGHPTSLPGNSVAAAGKRHRHASEEPVLWAIEDVLALREAHPQGHRPHLPWARLLQGPGQPGPGGPL